MNESFQVTVKDIINKKIVDEVSNWPMIPRIGETVQWHDSDRKDSKIDSYRIIDIRWYSLPGDYNINGVELLVVPIGYMPEKDKYL